ncbi:hypothetical protein BDR26DRAFT_881204 [Obelidium mucronatum]|nr:hypothetical protein BDR26DRAFT_881204 [Obelidium mucronatum]
MPECSRQGCSNIHPADSMVEDPEYFEVYYCQACCAEYKTWDACATCGNIFNTADMMFNEEESYYSCQQCYGRALNQLGTEDSVLGELGNICDNCFKRCGDDHVNDQTHEIVCQNCVQLPQCAGCERHFAPELLEIRLRYEDDDDENSVESDAGVVNVEKSSVAIFDHLCTGCCEIVDSQNRLSEQYDGLELPLHSNRENRSLKNCCVESPNHIYKNPVDGARTVCCRSCHAHLHVLHDFWSGTTYANICKKLSSEGHPELGTKKKLELYLKKHNLRRRRHSPEERQAAIDQATVAIRNYRENIGERTGYRLMCQHLHLDLNISIPRSSVRLLLREMEEGAVDDRKYRRLKRNNYVGKGPFEACAYDQHDKFRIYGLFVHGGIDCYSRYLMWLKVWKTNRQGALIARYYLEACRQFRKVWDKTIADNGLENPIPGKIQREMIQELVEEFIREFPEFADEVQINPEDSHQTVYDSRLNQKIECFWSQFLRQLGWDLLNQLEKGVANGFYDVTDMVQRSVFQFLAIPYIQQVFDAYKLRFNSRDKRLQRNRGLPSGKGSSATNLLADPTPWGGDATLGRVVSEEYLDQKIQDVYNEDHCKLFPDHIRYWLEETHQVAGGGQVVTSVASIWPIMKDMVQYINGHDDWPILITNYQEGVLGDIQ